MKGSESPYANEHPNWAVFQKGNCRSPRQCTQQELQANPEQPQWTRCLWKQRGWWSDPLWVPSGRKKRMKGREAKLFRPTVNPHHQWAPGGSHWHPALRSKYWSHVPTAPEDGEEISLISQAAEASYQPTPYLLLLSHLHILRQEANSVPKSVLVAVQWASQQKQPLGGGRVGRGGSREKNRNRWHSVHLQPMGVMWTPGSKTEITFQTVVALSMLLVMLCEAFSSAIRPNIQPVKKLWEINWRHGNS